MGACGSSLRCDICYDPGGTLSSSNSTAAQVRKCSSIVSELQADADIVGAGVLSAFFISAALTCGAILVGYLSNSLPEDITHDEIDNEIIKKYQASWVHKICIRPFTNFLLAIGSLLLRGEKPRARIISKPGTRRKQRSEALTRFILAVSDQQLVTGLATLVGALANRCRIYQYEFQVATSLAWFSATTHLATLGILRGYLSRHHTLRHWRLVGIIGTLILLSFSSFMSMITAIHVTPQDKSALLNPLQCAFMPSNGSKVDHRSPSSSITEQLNLAENAQQVDLRRVFHILNLILTLAIVFHEYFRRILDIYQPPGSPSLAIRIGVKVRGISLDDENLQKYYSIALEEKEKATILEFEKKWELQKSGRGRSTIFHITALNKNLPLLKYTDSVDSRHYHRSYLSKIPLIAFLFIYGFCQSVQIRWFQGLTLGNGTKTMDFGQITALFLLALPILTAAEAFSEASRRSKNRRSSRIEARSLSFLLPKFPSISRTRGIQPETHTPEEIQLQQYDSRETDSSELAGLNTFRSLSISGADYSLLEPLSQRRVIASICFFALDVFNVIVMGVGLNMTQTVALSAIIYAWLAGVAIVVYIHRVELVWEEVHDFGRRIQKLANDREIEAAERGEVRERNAAEDESGHLSQRQASIIIGSDGNANI